jgi:hypothetical protein
MIYLPYSFCEKGIQFYTHWTFTKSPQNLDKNRGPFKKSPQNLDKNRGPFKKSLQNLDKNRGPFKKSATEIGDFYEHYAVKLLRMPSSHPYPNCKMPNTYHSLYHSLYHLLYHSFLSVTHYQPTAYLT